MVEVEATGNVVEVEALGDEVLPVVESCGAISTDIIPTIEVFAEIQEWVLTSDNNYIPE